MIFSGSVVHLKGFASLRLCPSMNRRMTASHSVTELKMACFRRRLVSLAKNPSTAFSQEDEVGVKWNVQLGCRSSQTRTALVLPVERHHCRGGGYKAERQIVGKGR